MAQNDKNEPMETKTFVEGFTRDTASLCKGVLSDADLAASVELISTTYIKHGTAHGADSEDASPLEVTLANGNLVRKVWKGLDDQLGAQLSKFEVEDEDVAQDDVIFGLIRVICKLTQMWVDTSGVSSGDTIAKPIMSVLEKLHMCLFNLGHDAQLESHACRLFETFWAKDLQGKNGFMVFLLPVLLKRTLEESAKKADVKRVYAIRGTLEIIDFEDESSVPLKHHLLRCFLTPVYISCPEGRKFLCELFQIGATFVNEVHLTVRQQFGFASQTMMGHYAQIYFKAWRASAEKDADHAEEIKEAIEKCVVQDVIDWAVHCSDKKTCRNLRHLLAVGFHRNKSVKGVDEMLLRLYNPIIWRSFTAANAHVRRNAMLLFATAFPLQDPGQSDKEADALLQKQFDTVGTMLLDPCPQVREASIQCMSRILSTFWELIPSKTTQSMLSSLVNELIYDKSSPLVRASVLQGLGMILENPLSQEAMKKALGKLSNMIHDRSPKVRAAMVTLLHQIKSIKAIKFYDVVPVKHLLQCLSQDEKLSKPLVALLLDSFYPQGATGADQLKRSLALIKADRNAALAFYTHLHTCVSVGSVCKLALLLSKWVKAEVLKQKASRVDDAQIALVGINILWGSIALDLDQPVHGSARKRMEEAFSYTGFVKPLLEVVYSKKSCAKLKGPVTEIAGRLECDPDLLEKLIEQIKTFSMATEKELNAEIAPCLRCVTLWGEETLVLELIADALEFYSKENTQKRGKRKSKAKKVIPIEMCLWMLQWMLTQSPEARNRMLANKELATRITTTLSQFFNVLQDPSILECFLKICMHRKTLESVDEDEVVGSAFPKELHEVMKLADLFQKKSSGSKKRTRRDDADEAQRVHVVLCFIDTCLALSSHDGRSREAARVSEFLKEVESSNVCDSCSAMTRRLEKHWLKA